MIFKGAHIDPKDKECRTPLLLAAAKRSWNCVNTLLEKGANRGVKDVRNRNILHLIIKNGGKPGLFSFCMCSKVRENYIFNCFLMKFINSWAHDALFQVVSRFRFQSKNCNVFHIQAMIRFQANK